LKGGCCKLRFFTAAHAERAVRRALQDTLLDRCGGAVAHKEEFDHMRQLYLEMQSFG
jgi:hypothetical protein